MRNILVGPAKLEKKDRARVKNSNQLLTSLRLAASCCCVGVGGACATPPVASIKGEMSPAV